ncbi:hypothetical protein A3306_06805 [Rickettsia bellii]|uniref:Uncharacterized protein n=3 Tax=Rickettsia bellii TaxID=33990 RepID=Q1RIY7_RICBR|nr:hypothetical protein [Rickettsia bellii]ABE04677.1 unknown [Rickettsia bellii RML369-C]ABV79040.1 hypothetical protein A1I_03395 [Rickettsia bellii OSU 85-389]ARD86825.1 hypothetical protein A3306_06805 [Rickettsia bellii]KJV89460.1 hypothetical protein RBEAN4_0438 [Rickettsia bellii str. RML An4]KJV91726.1 hypothetical protein RBEMOGI_0334 [Rickettsia bellii str. RML Mogi]
MSKKKELDNIETTAKDEIARDVRADENKSEEVVAPALRPETIAVIEKELNSLTESEQVDDKPEAEKLADASIVIPSETGEEISSLQASDEVEALGCDVGVTE